MIIPDTFEGYGWLTPRDKILPCTTYGHWDVLFTNDEFLKISGMQAKIYTLDQMRNSFNSNTRGGWHVYEIAMDKFRKEAYTKLYNWGWIRIGKANDTIEFQGLKKQLGYKKDTLQSIVDEFSLITMQEFNMTLTGV